MTTTTQAPRTKATVEVLVRQAMAELAALPRQRRWDVEARRQVLRARVERLLDEHGSAEA